MLQIFNQLISRQNALALISSAYMLIISILCLFAIGTSLLIDSVAKLLVISSFVISLAGFALWQKVPNRYFLTLHSVMVLVLWSYLAFVGAPPIYLLAFMFPFGILWNAKHRYSFGIVMFLLAGIVKAVTLVISNVFTFLDFLHIAFVVGIGLLGISFDRHLRSEWKKLKNQTEQSLFEKESAFAKLAMAEQGFEQMSWRFVEQFKEPLNVILGMNTVLQSHETSQRRLDLLGRQFATGQYLVDLFEQFAANASQRAPLFNVQIDSFLMTDVVVVLENQVSALSSPTHKVEFVCDDKIHNHLMGDKIRLLQLIHALLKIVSDRLADGAVSLSIVGKYREGDSTITLTFNISGIGDLKDVEEDQGLNTEALEEPFYERVFSHLGYDQHFCRALLHAMGAELIRDERQGSLAYSFDITFTIKDDQQSIAEFFDSFQREVEPDWYGALQDYRILIVDDSEDTLFVLNELLTLAGAVIDTETDGNKAILRVLDGAKPYDVIIMDLQMPSISGAEVTKAIRQQYSKGQLPIIGLSVSNRPDEIKSSLAAGMNDFMVKPFNISHFIDFTLSSVSRRKHELLLPPVLDEAMAIKREAGRHLSSQYLTVPDGYDINSAISNLGGDKQLYLSMLDATLQEWSTNMNQLRRALQRNDIYYSQHVISRFANNAVMLGATDLDGYLRQLNFSLGLRAMDKDEEQVALQELGREIEERIWQASSVLKSVADSLVNS
jgi:CheY-like chemotaxis protein